MRITFSIFLLALLFCGCSQRHTAYLDQSVHIVAGKEIVVRDCAVSVKKRDGNSLEGIRIVCRQPGGKVAIITADTGTVIEGPMQSIEATPTDTKTQNRIRVMVIRNSVKMTLFDANVQVKTPTNMTRMTIKKAEYDF